MGLLDRMGFQNPFAGVRQNLSGIIDAPFPERPAPPSPQQISDLDALIKSLFPEVAGEGVRDDRDPTRAAIAEQGNDPDGPLADSLVKLREQENKVAQPASLKVEPVERRPLPNVQPRRPGPGRDMAIYRQAIKDIESSGGKYDIVGPTHPKMGRALGAYQVMESNLPAWSREVLGRVVTPEEFLASPQIQDQIFDTKFGQSISRYGSPEDAASVWFTGRPVGKSAGAATDSLGTSGNKYVAMFRQNVNKYGDGSSLPQPTQIANGAPLPSDVDFNFPDQRQPDKPRPPAKQTMVASMDMGEESEETIVPSVDPNVQRRRLIADAIKTTRDTRELKKMPRTEIIALLQEMGRGVAGLPGITKASV